MRWLAAAIALSLISVVVSANTCALADCATCVEAKECQWCVGSPSSCVNRSAALECPSTCREDHTCDGCGHHSNCSTCVAETNCGWSTTRQACVLGNATGACVDRFLHPDQWNFDNCANNCPAHRSCEDCTAHTDDGCVFCAKDNTCSAHAECACPRKAGDCQACSAHKDCGSCSKDSECGWCLHGDTCLPATKDKQPCGACEDPEKNWLYMTCKVNCPDFGDNCTECLEHYADSGCQWCYEHNTCVAPALAGGLLAASVASSPAPATCRCELHDHCGAPQQCAQFGSCSTCIGNARGTLACGWCSTSQKCIYGKVDGPCKAGQCESNAWNYDNCEKECPHLDTCTDCVAHVKDGCSFCLDTDKCLVTADATCKCLAQDCGAMDCHTFSGKSCDVCTASIGCGWCESTKTCAPGSADGPCTASACEVGWTIGCDKQCNEHTSCEKCEKDSSCGWCAGTPDGSPLLTTGGSPQALTSQCVLGTSTGPGASLQCQRWHYDKCPGCPTAQTCRECVGKDECGWCIGEGSNPSCTEGMKEGPFRPENSCPVWSFNTCEGSCPTYETCHDCLEEPACGWCHDSQNVWGFCIGRSFHSVCDQWNVDSCAKTCENNLVCGVCTQNSSCGWCTSPSDEHGLVPAGFFDGTVDTGTCVEGSGSGPKNHETCQQWSYGPKSCRPFDCSGVVTTCDDCTAHAACGWCDVQGGMCEAGTAAGPVDGQCPDGRWSFGASSCVPPIFSCTSYKSCSECIANGKCGWCEETGCFRGGKDGPYPPVPCISSWFYVSCTPIKPLPPPPPPAGGFSTVEIVAITAGSVLVPVLCISLIVYRRFMKKYGYTPLG